MTLADLLRAESIDVAAIKAALDAMSHEARVVATRTLPRGLFAVLFDAVAGGPAPAPHQLVPPDFPAHQPICHRGVNNLPLFRIFEKPMFRLANGGIGGRNVQFWSWLTGPGYFAVHEPVAGQTELLFDYVNLPASKPDAWPAIRSNSRGFSFFVFRGMSDYVRVVSEHVTIGKAFRNGKDQGTYFILVREASPPLLADPSSG